MQVRGELGPLLGPDPLGPLRRQAATEAPEERGQDQAEGDDHDHRVRAASRTPPKMSFEERNSSAAPITSSTPKTPR